MKYWCVMAAFILIITVQSVSSEVQNLGTFKQYNPIQLTQTCDNCTYVNITKVQLPNSTIIKLGQLMVNYGNDFSYQFNITDLKGDYIVTTCGDDDGTITCDSYSLKVNVLGQVLTSSQATLYTIVIAVAFLFFLITITFGIYLPYSNNKDELSGYILSVSNLKYLKMFSLAIAYLMLMLIFYFGWVVSYAFLELDFLASLFNFAFYTMAISLIVLFPLSVYLLIANWIRDSQIASQLQRGLRIR